MKRTSDALSETFQVADVTPPSDNSNGTGGGSGGGGGGSNATRPTSSNSNKKRNKLIKSCGFCRRRKLRCDQQKPMCSTCISRNLVACQYAEEFNKSVEKKAIYGTFSNMELLKKIDDLENKIQLLENDRNTNPPTNFMYSSSNFPLLNATACGESTETSSPLSDGVINPYADRHYVQYKHSGRSIIYGPTSMRTQIFNTNWGFMSKYKQLWAKIKVERNIWKKNNQKTMCRELGLLKESSWEPGSLLKQICKFLPTYEKIFSIIDHIFDDELINEFNIILDKTKIRKDFMDYFMPGKDLLPNGERPIVYILSNSKNNYYKAAVILMILCLRHFYGNIPEPLERFLIFLNGTTTEKIFYIERAQMLILIFYHRELHSFGGDGSRMLNLNESLFATVTTVGLHLDIRKVFKGEEKSMGSMESLENVWFMAILIDYSMSAHIGKPLLITKYYLDERQEYCVLNDQSKTYEGKMKRYLKLARSMLFALYDREKFPDLKLFSRQLISFVEEELAPLKDFTDETLAVEVPLRETRILCMALGLILSFYALVHSVLKVRNFEAKNNTFQLVLVNFSVIVNTTIRCFLIDKERFPECFEPSYPHLPPTLAMSMSLRGGLFSKTLVFFCSLVFFKLTLFENGICLSNDMECGWSDLSSITVPLDKDLSMGTAMKLYTSISDRLVKAGDKLLIRTLQNSPEFLIELAVEKTSRTILGNVLEFRRMTEETWLSQIKQELDPQNHQLPTELRSEQEQQQEQQQQQQQQQHHQQQENMRSYMEILQKFVRFIGPGILVSVAYMDPGNYATSVSGGAQYKYTLLFSIFISNIFAVLLQCLCVKLGTVTGYDLAENCRHNLPKKLNYTLYFFAEVAIIATDLAEVVGTAIALQILFKIPLTWGVLLTVLDVLVILMFYTPNGQSLKKVRVFEFGVGILVIGTCVCFVLELFKISIPDKAELFKGFLPSTIIFKEQQALYISLGILGATVMPHSLYLGSSIVKPRLHDYDMKKYGKVNARPSLSAIKYSLNYAYAELIISLFLIATFVNSAILIVAGATLSGQPEAEDADLLSIYKLLVHYISPAAGLIFALAMLCSGQSAGIICTLAGQIVSEGFLQWSLPPWATRLCTRLIAIVPCVFVTLTMGEKGISDILNLSQVILSLILPIVSAPLIYFTANRKLMVVHDENGVVRAPNDVSRITDETTPLNSKHRKIVDFTNSRLLTYTSIFVWALIGSLNCYLVISFCLGADIHF